MPNMRCIEITKIDSTYTLKHKEDPYITAPQGLTRAYAKEANPHRDQMLCRKDLGLHIANFYSSVLHLYNTRAKIFH